jgi:transcriptional regulator with XRE-family HTH domain
LKGPIYRDHDYAFGQVMTTLRTALGMTQASLAGTLGVSRRAVGDWEAGNSYPKAENLKQVIALAAEHEALQVGHEAEEVRMLWLAAHQKVLLDEAWLAGLLSRLPAWPGPVQVEEEPGAAQAVRPANAGPRLDWGEAPACPHFYGRGRELDLLAEWVVVERCRVVSVLGLGGIGKSALAVSLMHRVAGGFDVVIWRSLRDLASCDALLDELLRALAPQMLGVPAATLEQRQGAVLEQMRSSRVLVVLDNFESVLDEGECSGRLRPGYEGIERYLRLCSETAHQSCVLLTSREKPAVLIPLEGHRSPVRVLRLGRLELDACTELLVEKGLTGSPGERARLIEAYGGNPLALKIAAQTIIDLFHGEIGLFLAQGEVIFGGVRELLGEQFARLSSCEQGVLYWLAVMREPVTLDELAAVQVTGVARGRLLEAVEALHRRSMVEPGRLQGSFTLQSVVLEYATARLIIEVGEAITQGRPGPLVEHALAPAQTRADVRECQERALLAPLLAHLRGAYGQAAALEERLLALLREISTWPAEAQGYGPANVTALLVRQRGHLRGVDLSGLVLRGVTRQGSERQDADLAGAVAGDNMLGA